MRGISLFQSSLRDFENKGISGICLTNKRICAKSAHDVWERVVKLSDPT